MKRYIADGLTEYVQADKKPWHMPGHKRKALWEQETDVLQMLSQAMRFDVTEVPGTDDLYNPEGFIAESMKQLRKIYGTAASYYLVNGSTCGILTAIASCCKSGDGIIVARNCHKSVYNAVQMLDLKPLYLQPKGLAVNEEICAPITVEQVDALLFEATKKNQNKNIRAMVLTSPTYEGVVSDIRTIAAYLHKRHIALIVDEAHGAHLPFVKELPASAVGQGADFVVQSLHKTLAALTQTAILHVCTEQYIVPAKHWLQVFMSSSPSYIMLCSMEEAVCRAYEEEHSGYVKILRGAREQIAKLKNISLIEPADVVDGALDESRIVLGAKDCTGIEIEGTRFLQLLEEYGIVGEMAGVTYVVLISTMEDDVADLAKLIDTLEIIDERLATEERVVSDEKPEYTEEFLLSLVGTHAVDNVYVYPPGSYLLTPGELVTKDIALQLIAYQRSGKTIRGHLS